MTVAGAGVTVVETMGPRQVPAACRPTQIPALAACCFEAMSLQGTKSQPRADARQFSPRSLHFTGMTVRLLHLPDGLRLQEAVCPPLLQPPLRLRQTLLAARLRTRSLRPRVTLSLLPLLLWRPQVLPARCTGRPLLAQLLKGRNDAVTLNGALGDMPGPPEEPGGRVLEAPPQSL